MFYRYLEGVRKGLKGILKVWSSQERSSRDRSGQVRTGQVGTDPVRAGQVGTGKLGQENRDRKVGTGQDGQA